VILVTGAGGFVGSHIVQQLARQGDSVLAVDLAAPSEPVAALWKSEDLRIRCEQADITDKVAMERLFTAYEVDRVIHAATITPTAEREFTEPDRILHVGVTGSSVVLSVAINHGVKRFIYLSSASIYEPTGGSDCVLDESATLQRMGLYPLTKVAGEWLTRYLTSGAGMESASARIAACFGPLERNTGARTRMSPVWQMVQMARSSGEIRLGTPEHVLDFTHVSDIASGVVRLLSSEKLNHESYNVSGGRCYSFLEVAQAVANRLPGTRIVQNSTEPDAVSAGAGSRSGRLAIHRLAGDTAFAPRHDIQSGVSDYIDWLESHPF